MTWLSTLIALSLLGCGTQQSPPSPPDLVVIDGKTDPDKLPEYLIWRNGFDILVNAGRAGREAILSSVKLPPAEMKLVLAESEAQAAREAACRDRQERVAKLSAGGGWTAEKTTSALHTLMLDCRQQVLDGKDRLLQSLSTDAQLALIEWINDRRSGLKVFVLKHELEFFRKPR